LEESDFLIIFPENWEPRLSGGSLNFISEAYPLVRWMLFPHFLEGGWVSCGGKIQWELRLVSLLPGRCYS